VLTATESRLPANGVRSLVWDGESVVDWVSGGKRYRLNGDIVSASVRYAYRFDAAVSLVDSNFSVIYTRFGTKGLLLNEGRVVRELNRSFYHADVYEYPIVLFRLPSGREVVAHCPDDYCRLDIEDLATGEVLTRSSSRKPSDIFHSRLSVSPNGRFLVSSGWLWHPVDCVRGYDVVAALEDPTHLDGAGIGLDAFAEESSSTFFRDGRLAVALKGDIDSDEGPTSQGELRTVVLGDFSETTVVSPVGRLGTIAAVGTGHVLALYEHPRLIDVHTGIEVLSWPHINSGTQTSSIVMSEMSMPVTAVDTGGRRFAIADAEGITVIQLLG